MKLFWSNWNARDWLLLCTPTMAMVLSLALGGDVAAGSSGEGPHWSEQQLHQLQALIADAPRDALPRPDTTAFDAALVQGRTAAIDREATVTALQLAHMHLGGVSPAQERTDWHIPDSDAAQPLEPLLAAALAQDRIDALFASLRPSHPAYAALRAALAREGDPARRLQIARNMERWRWLPRFLGDDYLIANAAGFEVSLWRGGQRVQSWPAISGKVQTPTPAIAAMVTAVNFNPWWEVPQSISSVSRMSPRRGYVFTGKRYRQKPGPYNALGRMKLVMTNRWNIYLHDTPSRSLFGASERAFSHGCIRVSDALGFAQTLLGETRSAEAIGEIIEGEKSVVVGLPRQLPVYVAYFTADAGADGAIRFHKDIYGHDRAIVTVTDPGGPRLAMR